MSDHLHFGRYQLIRSLGEGGMAEVWLADEKLAFGGTRPVALKRMKADLGTHTSDDDGRQMFMSEALIAARLSHPNIVQLYDFGEIDGHLYLAMELIDGPSLRQLISAATADHEPVPIAAGLKIVSMICDGMAYAHALRDRDTDLPLNLVHRDLTPDNILLSRTTGQARVVDFGIARSQAQIHKTRTGLVKGKTSFMAPEQLRGLELDRRTDVFALGLVLYELLTGVQPFDLGTESKRINAVLFEEPAEPTSLRPELPLQVNLLLARALSKNRDQRYSSCTELGRDLDRISTDLKARYQPGAREFGPTEMAALIEKRFPPGRVVDAHAATTEVSSVTEQHTVGRSKP